LDVGCKKLTENDDTLGWVSEGMQLVFIELRTVEEGVHLGGRAKFHF
jgi:hypothetical protein